MSPPDRSSTGRWNTSAYSASIQNTGCRHSKHFASGFIRTIEPRPPKSSERAVSERTGYELDCRIVLPDGAMKYIHAIGHPVFNASGDLVEAVGTVDGRDRAQAGRRRAVPCTGRVGPTSREWPCWEKCQPLSPMKSTSRLPQWSTTPVLVCAGSRRRTWRRPRESAARIIADGHRAGEIIGRIRAFVNKTPSRKDWVDINETIREVIALVGSEVYENRVSLQTQLSDDAAHSGRSNSIATSDSQLDDQRHRRDERNQRCAARVVNRLRQR